MIPPPEYTDPKPSDFGLCDACEGSGEQIDVDSIFFRMEPCRFCNGTGKEKKTYNLEIYPEICCEYCNEVIHNHFDCPICNVEYASTDAYYDLYEEFLSNSNIVLKCEECEASFKLLTTDSVINGEWELLEPE